jgi:hypothetical protein
LFDEYYGMKHHLGLKIILLPKTNKAFVPHDLRKSHPERDAQGFFFTVVTTAALTISVIAAAAITITTVIVLQDLDNLLGCH